MATPSPKQKEQVASPALSSASKSSPSTSIQDQEDANTHTLRRMWQRYAQTIIHADRTADRTAEKGGSDKELGDAVIEVLRSNIGFRRTITHVEAKLTGQQKETEALEACMKSQPCAGIKRKRNDGNVNGQSDGAGVASTSSQAS